MRVTHLKFQGTFAMLFLWGMMVGSNAGFAQTLLEDLPPQANPGGILPTPTEPFQQGAEKYQLQQVIPEEPPAPTVQSITDSNVELSQPNVMVTNFEVEGATLLSPETLQSLVSPYENRIVTRDELGQLVESINQAYWENGYLSTRAWIPQQEVASGIIIIEVREGHIGQIQIEGNRYNRDVVIERQLHITPGEALNMKQLEEDLAFSNQRNPFQIQATLAPEDDNTDFTDIRLDVKERQPWQIIPTFDNQGRPYIGYYRGGVGLYNSSLFGYGDQLYGRYVGASGTQLAYGSYFIPINKNGDQIGLNYGYGHVHLNPDPVNFDDEGTAHNLGILYSHPLNERRTWIGDIGINAWRVQSYNDDQRTRLSEVRALQLGLNYDNFDRWGRTFARVETSAGLGILGGNAHYWKMNGYFTRLINLAERNLLILRGYAQYSPDSLPIAVAYQLGGAYTVRGYTEGLLIADSGYNFSVEDRFPIPLLSRIWPWLDQRLQGAVFFDVGQAFLDGSSPYRFANGSRSATLASVGGGLRMRLSRLLMGFIDVGFGLVNQGNIEPKGFPTARIHFGIASNLLPDYWRR